MIPEQTHQHTGAQTAEGAGVKEGWLSLRTGWGAARACSVAPALKGNRPRGSSGLEASPPCPGIGPGGPFVLLGRLSPHFTNWKTPAKARQRTSPGPSLFLLLLIPHCNGGRPRRPPGGRGEPEGPPPDAFSPAGGWGLARGEALSIDTFIPDAELQTLLLELIRSLI